MFLKYPKICWGLQNTKSSSQLYSKKRQQIPASFQPSEGSHCMDKIFPHSKSYRINIFHDYRLPLKSTTNKKKSKESKKIPPHFWIFLHLSTPASLQPIPLPSCPQHPPICRLWSVRFPNQWVELHFVSLPWYYAPTWHCLRNEEPERDRGFGEINGEPTEWLGDSYGILLC